MTSKAWTLLGASTLALLPMPGFAQATSAGTAAGTAPAASNSDAQGVADIVVTAQKREQKLNDVPVSVSVASGAELANRGISNVGDLVKVVPGFNYTVSAFGTPVYTLRGIGFYDTSLAAKATVGIYNDEVSIPFAIESRGATLDLQRVEVLKGPQGTLFGQNATGGAINYIAAKPTRTFTAGVDLGYAQYGEFDAGGYVSGPIGDKIGVRLSAKTEQGGAWQKSYTRKDSLGDKKFTTGRLLVDLRPTEKLRFEINLNGFIDKGDDQAAQDIAFTPLNPNPAHYGGLPTYPLAPHNDRAADWTPDTAPSKDDRYYQTSLRADWEFANDLTATSITSYSDFRRHQVSDPDGLALRDYVYHTTGTLKTVAQELRVAGRLFDSLNVVVGGNYSKDRTYQRDNQGPYTDSTPAYQLTDAIGVPPFFSVNQFVRQNFTTKAVFGNVDYDVTSKFTLHGGVRYTDTKSVFSGCTEDAGDGALAFGIGTLLNFIRGGAGLPTLPAIARGACVTIHDNPARSDFLTPGQVDSQLKEHNVSWRGGVDYKPNRQTLLYASVSKGYKAGGYPVLAASGASQYNPVTQESVIAYEAGVKATVLNRMAQINAAVFYYDYSDKQLKGRVVANPNIFGPLEALVNIPKSSVTGGELQIDLAPTKGLRFSTGVTYIKSKIRGSFVNFDSYGVQRNFGGEAFPYTPKIQIVIDGQYDWRLSDRLGAFVGASTTYQSKTNAALGNLSLLAIDDYTLVDVRLGLETADKKYRLTVFGRNLANKYYWTNATRIIDTTVRYAGRPRTFGVTLSAKY